jgi:hypothetical protein
MKHLPYVLAVVSLMGGRALYAAGPLPTPSASPASQTTKAKSTQPKSKSQAVSAEFVAYDANTKTMTVKDANGQTSSAPLESKAIKEVSQLHLKSGDHVMLTWRNNAQGEHQAVTDIKAAKTKA